MTIEERSHEEAAFARAGHGLRPLLLDAREAHRTGAVTYEEDGTLVLRRDGDSLRVPPSRQRPCIRATFEDLNKSLSRLANSPLMEGGRTLRDLYEEELARYEEICAAAYAEGRFEPDYGTYVFDPREEVIYLVAPERWHRLALVTSNSKLLEDPAGALSWRQVRERLEGAVVGFAGVSVGGNLLEGWLREARPRRVKVADPDWVELPNLNRGERMSLRHVVASRGARFDPRNPYDVPRVPKAAYIAHEQLLVDPYVTFDVYEDGITRANLDRFIAGDGAGEPKLDILVEEMDKLELKVLVRQVARRHGVDVLMLSDFGHQAHVMWNSFRERPDAALGYGASDERLLALLEESRSGDRRKVFEFVGALCGEDFAGDQFRAWIEGRGEQPTGSLPQSGATAMASGAIGGKEIALRVLGHPGPKGDRVVYDLLHRAARVG
jgi:hypothetical protein